MAGGQAAKRHQSADGGQIGEFNQLREFLRSLAEYGAAAGVNELAVRPPRSTERRGKYNLSGHALGEHFVAREMDGVDGRVASAGLENVLGMSTESTGPGRPLAAM